MEQVIVSCNAAADYPKNLHLIQSSTYDFITNAYFDKLNERKNDLFHNSDKAALDFWEFGDSAKAFWPNQICSPTALREHLRFEYANHQMDPKCRFVFVQAPHSRGRLYTTHYMLALSMTYLQVMPGFLDFVFPFGKQSNERGFHFGGFRYQSRLPDSERGLRVPELGWSGRDYKLCFNLKSVEQARGGGEPWSIRQAAIHHSFDVESGQASWIVIKANKLLKDRIKSATGARGLPKISSYETLDRAFASALATHLIFCQWSGENWRWYIDFLEETLQETTQRTLSPIVRTPTSPTADPAWSPTRQSTYANNSFQMSIMGGAKQPAQQSPPVSSLPAGFHPVASGNGRPALSIYDPGNLVGTEKGPEFSFTDLQRAQKFEEKANAAMLILKNNISVFADLQKYYRTIAATEGWPSNLTTQCHGDMLRFEQDLSSIKNDMQLQLSRIETLLQLIANRKSLLYGIMKTQNTEANKISTDYIQRMTADMHEIAVKTKQETISMRIITFVTLCFLPGTFISTLMSTDIIHFDKTTAGPFDSAFSLGALRLYLIISLPLVALTLVVWYWFYNREIRQRDRPSWHARPIRWIGRCITSRSYLRRSGPPLLPT